MRPDLDQLPDRMRAARVRRAAHVVEERQKALMEKGLRWCKRCDQEKPVEEFNFKPGRGDYDIDCRSCHSEREKERRRANPSDRSRKAQLARYGVTLEELVERQGHPFCALCTKNIADCVDHDHETRRVRGALCRVCNMALAYFEDEAWMKRAAAYTGKGVI
jgi:hypothetical protein